ncbi:hypothetical protein BXZ70DRAFT_445191 [Cristinia sonorae]|uniref:Uncharacterized protein n=1 Tax=Cristinia sonorae TaxID=1940300 RepID=A0A8K0XM50_9AGAR|nr:hypothetical protein BXZ70DRAFT_445191 [Cristinia sonorae]
MRRSCEGASAVTGTQHHGPVDLLSAMISTLASDVSERVVQALGDLLPSRRQIETLQSGQDVLHDSILQLIAGQNRYAGEHPRPAPLNLSKLPLLTFLLCNNNPAHMRVTSMPQEWVVSFEDSRSDARRDMRKTTDPLRTQLRDTVWRESSQTRRRTVEQIHSRSCQVKSVIVVGSYVQKYLWKWQVRGGLHNGRKEGIATLISTLWRK